MTVWSAELASHHGDPPSSTPHPPMPEPRPSEFATTRWTLVASSSSDSSDGREALRELCAAYYHPIERFVAAAVRDGDRARDLTHDFFARLLEKPGFAGLERGRGRFRSYLLGALKHFLADARDREHAAKRGAGIPDLSLDGDGGSPTSPVIDPPDPGATPSDRHFDRAWALAVIDRSLRVVEDELTASAKAAQFDVLKPWLTGEGAAQSQAEAAAALGISEGAVKVAIHRLRRRFRDQVRSEIAETVTAPEDIDAELRYLVEVLS